MSAKVHTLADRLGVATHVSPLEFKLARLARKFPCDTATCIEDWLIEAANARGARIVARPHGPDLSFRGPGADEFTNEELVVAICQLQRADMPQILRLAAQLVSRKAVDGLRLKRVAERERVGRILAELARQALKVDPAHELWSYLLRCFGRDGQLREPLLHWTRLAEPLMKDGRVNAAGWRLVA